jgi:SSS family solute:Na+ symporter
MNYLDLVSFLLILVLTSIVGFASSKSKKTTSKDYFLAGGKIRWWGVAGSLFATNISSNQLVGMLGVGYSIGFAQSFYEFGAVPALLILAYFFLPLYRRLEITTLSEFLEIKYHRLCRAVYSIILILLILIQMTASLYIGARSTHYLTGGLISYEVLVISLAFICLFYTYHGGLETVVRTDVVQTFALLIAAFLLTYFTFSQPEVDSFWNLIQDREILKLRLPSDHPDLPFPGILSGLFLLHLFYWSTNQYIVQRALGAVSQEEARIGIFVASFLKLIVPFLTICTGIAATFLIPLGSVLPDDAFASLVQTVVPASFGLRGLILAGVFSAIVSSLDSMANSASTLFSIDIYGKYINQNSEDKDLIAAGKKFILFITGLSVLIALVFFSPNSGKNFFLVVSENSSYLTPGILSVFLAGLLLKNPSKRYAIAIIFLSPFLSLGIESVYNHYKGGVFVTLFGERLNFLYRVFIVFSLSFLGFILTPGSSKSGEKQETIMRLSRQTVQILFCTLAVSLFVLILYRFDILNQSGVAVVNAGLCFQLIWNQKGIERFLAGLLACLTLFIFIYYI